MSTSATLLKSMVVRKTWPEAITMAQPIKPLIVREPLLDEEDAWSAINQLINPCGNSLACKMITER
ncbi:MAG: hypothetical protein AB8B84_15545 [Granulosicoccus sp.]